MLKVEYSPAALADLQGIRDYISANWGERAASSVLKKITSAARRLEQFPLSGADLGKFFDVQQDYIQQLFGVSPELE